MKKRVLSAVLAAAMAVSLAACGGSSSNSASQSSSSSSTESTSTSEATDAGEEVTGTITVYTTMDDSQQEILTRLWSERYPDCDMEIVADSVGTLATKIRADEKSGADVVIGGMFAADGDTYHDILQPYTSKIDSEQGYHDPSGYYTFYDVQVMCFVINQSVLDKLGVEKVEGYADLLNDKLKGKIITANPAASSSGWRQLQTILATMGDEFDDDKGWEYVESLLPLCVQTDSSKDVFNLVDQGEYAVGLTYESTPAGLIAKGGTNMELVYMKEGNTAMAGGAAIVKDAPNLPAAQAMMDLLASKEFQEERAALAGRGSNSSVQLTGLPEDAKLGLVDLDFDYLNQNKEAILNHYNDIFVKVQ